MLHEASFSTSYALHYIASEQRPEQGTAAELDKIDDRRAQWIERLETRAAILSV